MKPFLFLPLFMLSTLGSESRQAVSEADRLSAAEVRARFQEFNRAWERRDLDFVRDYFAHDPDMLLFFERRQLRGWDRVESLYRNMFANASNGTVKSRFENLEVGARGDLAYVAANFRLEIQREQELTVDEGRQTVVYEKREGRWVVVHRHTSFQAPPGPQRRVPLHTEPGPLWSPTLEGAWRGEDGATLLATAAHLLASGIASLPGAYRYRIEGKRVQLDPVSEAVRPAAGLEELEITSKTLSFRAPGESRARSWQRIE
jgi:uncharacterized protein (TIGR02246 family)